MSQPKFTVKKTKKSSYKPLSKLNQDHLTDLRHMPSSEYSGRVFYCNISTKARLRHSVNVWFRDHQHNLAMLSRQQRSVQQLMYRMHHDRHRAKRDDYKRQQEETREKLYALQIRLLQRRVVQKFQLNAVAKMAERGEQSLSGLRLTGKLPAHVTDTEASFPGHLTNPNTDHSQESSNSPEQCSTNNSSSPASTKMADSDFLTDNTSENQQGTQTKHRRKKSLRSFSDGDIDLDQDGDLLKSPATKKKASLDAIPEDGSAAVVVSSEDSNEGGMPEKHNGDRKSSFSTNSKFLEVRKDRPQSPNTVTVSRARPSSENTKSSSDNSMSTSEDTLQGPEQEETSPQPNKQGSNSNSAHSSSPNSLHYNQKGSCLAPIPPISTAKIEKNQFTGEGSSKSKLNCNDEKRVSENKTKRKDSQDSVYSTKRKDSQPTESSLRRKDSQTGKTSEVSWPGPKPSEKEPSTSTDVFSKVPTRDEVLQDAVLFLSLDEVGGGGVGKTRKSSGSQGLAASIRRQRKRDAKRRSDLLDKEPLVQYYRSVRGTLEPLLSEPTRRSFPFPSRHAQYQQSKLLREQQQQDIERKHNIDNFFNDIFKETEKAKPAPQPPPPQDKKKPGMGQMAGQLNLVLRMKRQGTILKKDSFQQLASCNYLRLYHWDRADTKGDGSQDPAAPAGLTSWASAESRLKAGFLALDFTS